MTLPALADVRGGFNMQSSSPDFNCGPFETAKQNSVIKGTFVCARAQSNPGTAGSRPTSSSTPSAGDRFKVTESVVLGGSSVLAGLLALLL